MKSISQLKSHGFDVSRIKKNVSTVLEHENLFMVEGTHGPVQAIKNEDTNKYTITFSGLCTNDQIPYDVNLVSNTLLASINETANQVELARRQTTTQPKTTKVQIEFKHLKPGDEFFKESSTSTYVKVDSSSYSKQSSIASSMLMFMEGTDLVNVAPLDIGLTDEQKWDIVFAVPENLDTVQASATIMADLDYIPGVEDLPEIDKQKLASELLSMWQTHHNK